MKFIKVDLKRALLEPSFLYTVSFGSIVAVFSFLCVMMMEGKVIESHLLFQKSQSLILPFIAPILAAVPYSNMIMLEEDCGYQKLLRSKRQGKNYEFPRFFVNGLIGGGVLLIPVALLYGICAVCGFNSDLGSLLVVLGYDFCFGFTYASLSYGLTFVCRKRYLPLVTPQVFYLLFIYAFPYLGLDAYYPPLAFSPWILGDITSAGRILFTLLLMLLISCFLVIFQKLCVVTNKSR